MSILGPKCGINGCKKGKLRPHTHIIGDMGRTDADYRLIELARIYSQMTGKPFTVPGGLDSSDINRYMTGRLKDGQKQSKAFRDELKRRGRRI